MANPSPSPENRFATNQAGPMGQPISFRLPVPMDEVFRASAGDDLGAFARYALARFLIREGWIDPENCPLLPFKLELEGDIIDYQLATDAAAAVRQAEALGSEKVLQVTPDIGEGEVVD